jgi:hypothetical protein
MVKVGKGKTVTMIINTRPLTIAIIACLPLSSVLPPLRCCIYIRMIIITIINIIIIIINNNNINTAAAAAAPPRPFINAPLKDIDVNIII